MPRRPTDNDKQQAAARHHRDLDSGPSPITREIAERMGELGRKQREADTLLAMTTMASLARRALLEAVVELDRAIEAGQENQRNLLVGCVMAAEPRAKTAADFLAVIGRLQAERL